MIHTTTVALAPHEVIARAKAFFAERMPNTPAFPEQEGPTFVVLRGQGGEEVVISASPVDEAGKREAGRVRSRVRASTLFFDQAIDRFFSTLPLESGVEVA